MPSPVPPAAQEATTQPDATDHWPIINELRREYEAANVQTPWTPWLQTRLLSALRSRDAEIAAERRKFNAEVECSSDALRARDAAQESAQVARNDAASLRVRLDLLSHHASVLLAACPYPAATSAFKNAQEQTRHAIHGAVKVLAESEKSTPATPAPAPQGATPGDPWEAAKDLLRHHGYDVEAVIEAAAKNVEFWKKHPHDVNAPITCTDVDAPAPQDADTRLIAHRLASDLDVERIGNSIRARLSPVTEDGPCALCGEPTQHIAGDPGKWPLMFSRPDGTGVALVHCVQCVTARVYQQPPTPQNFRQASSQPRGIKPGGWMRMRLRGRIQAV